MRSDLTQTAAVAPVGIPTAIPSNQTGPMRPIVFSSLALVTVLVIAPLIGSTHVDLSRALQGVSPDHEILFYARLPRVILAALSGAALAITGVLFQCLLRDPLAEPYTLGVSSGASVGAVVAICLGFQAGGLASLAGAGAVLFLVLGIAWEGRRVSSFTLLLAGVTMNSMCFAVILFLHNLANFSQSFAISRWLMGGIDAVEYSTLGWLAAAVVPVSVLISMRAKQWNLMAVGEEWASSRGISTTIYTTAGYVAGALLTGLATALTGPIGFVGLIVPHALRLRLGADHRVLLPCSVLLGAAFLALCDTLSRTVLAPTEIPVGVITALCGGPFFIWLLRSKRRSLWM
ncbi:MAG: iron ABC transporter permease [Bryobacteraceae bacterium]